jgi:LPPG:FO 2-phospho-L-lactate transferase
MAPVVAVSPLIGGRAVKGPTAKMMAELGMTPSAGAVARRYDDVIDGYVCDFADMDQVAGISAKVTLGQTLMSTLADREALARIVLGAARVLRRDR